MITAMTMATAISLGVGSSSLAITSFFAAIADGQIDQSERHMLGVIYWVLRVAMVLILLTISILTFVFPDTLEGTLYIWILIGVLYVNAILMTKHWIPVQVGPALQAASWYTLGFMLSIQMFAIAELTHFLFAQLYVIDFIVAYVIVNAFMYIKKRQRST